MKSVGTSKIHISDLSSANHSKFCNDVGIWSVFVLVLCGKRCRVSRHHCKKSYNVQEQNHGNRHMESKRVLAESKENFDMDATSTSHVKCSNRYKRVKLSHKMRKCVCQ